MLAWLHSYCSLVLELDAPILEALGLYRKWVQTALTQYRANRRTFEWERYRDPGVLYTIMCDGHEAVFHVHAVGLFSVYPEVEYAIVATTGFALAYVPNQTLELCLAAVRHWGCALRYVQPALQRRYPEIIRAALEEDPGMIHSVPAELLVAAVATSAAASHHSWLLTDTPLLC